MSKIEERVAQEVVAIELSKITLHPNNGRDKKQLDLETLKSSIQATGQLVPGLARKLDDGTIQLVCGSRRYKALTELKAPTMNLIIGKLNDYEAVEAMVTENLQRKNMTQIEELVELKRLVELGDAFSLTPESVSARLGRPIYWARRMLALTRLTKKELKWFEDFRFSPSIDLLARFAAINSDARIDMFQLVRWCNTEKDAIKTLEKSAMLLCDAPFDKELAIGYGPCSKCPNRSSAQPGLWANNTDVSDKKDRCLSALCFKLKVKTTLVNKAIELANQKPNEPFYVNLSHGEEGFENAPSNMKFTSDYLYAPDKGQETRKVFNLNPNTGKFGVMNTVGVDKVAKTKTMKTAKTAPAKEQIAAKQESLHGLRLKNVSEQIRAAIDEFKTAPPIFAGMTHMEVLNVALVFGIRGYSSFEKVIVRLDSQLDEAKMQKLVWEGIRQRVAENVHCQTGTDAMDKEPRLKRICKLLGLNFDVLFELAKADKPDPKSLVTLLAQEKLNEKIQPKKK